jgi:hypothetical protein
MSLLPFAEGSGLGQRLYGTTRVLPQAPRCAIFTLFSEAGSNIVEPVAIPLAARSGSVIAAVAV